MSLAELKNMIPDYAKDIKLNISSLLNDETLTQQQLWGCFLASAMASQNATLTKAAYADAQEKLDASAIDGVKAAASIMAMNNMYYRFVHITALKEFQTMPAKLRMNVIANPGVEMADFELWSLAVSVVNGCGMCIDAHAKKLMDEGMSKEQIQTAARIASVVHATARVIEGEEQLSALNVSNDVAAA
jgi:alkyl hydroperoxide reductase subunit D